MAIESTVNSRGEAEDGANEPLVGREAELRALTGLLQRAREGQGGLALIGGEAGVGKTTLVQALASEARAHDTLALSGNCYDLEYTPPFGPWLDMLRTCRAEDGLANLPEVLRRAITSSGQVPRASETATQIWNVLGEVAARGPLLLILEDMHWADEASVELLRLVARRASDLPLLIAVTYRDIELTPGQALYRQLPMLARETRTERVSLRRLDVEQTRQLLAARYHLARQDEDRLLDYVWRYGEGNPFFVAELARNLEYEGTLRRGAGGWKLGELAAFQVPPLVRQVIGDRLLRLSGETQELLQVAAVIGSETPLDLWQEVAGASEEALATCIEEAMRARLLEEAAGRPAVRFRHALIRAALYDGLNILRRRAWHRRVAEILAAPGGNRPQPDPDAVADHLYQAGDERAVEWLTRAGRRAAQAFAFHDAGARYRQALALLGSGDERAAERAWLLCELADANRYIDLGGALAYLDAARDLSGRIDDPALRAVVLWCRARIRGYRGENTLDELDEAMAIYAGLSEADRERLEGTPFRYVVSEGTLATWLAAYGRYADVLERTPRFLASEAAPRSPVEHNVAGNALAGLGMALAAMGYPERARPSYDGAAAHYRQAGNALLIAVSRDWELAELAIPYFTDDLVYRDRIAAEQAASWNRASLFAPGGRAGSAGKVAYDVLLLEGRWDELEESAHLQLEHEWMRLDVRRALATLARLRGFEDRAWTYIRESLPGGPASEPTRFYYPLILKLQQLAARLALDAGDAALAREWIEALERWLGWSGRVLDRAACQGLWSRYRELRGEPDRALEAARRAVELASEPRQPRALAEECTWLASLLVDLGRHNEAEAHIERAWTIADAIRAPHLRAETLLVRASLLQSTGRASEAAGLLDEIVAVAGALRAGPLLERARLARERAAVPGDIEPPGGLSPRELEVLRLVARGLTDAEIGEELFISPRTVGGHLRSIYTKLGVASRTAATAHAFEHGIL